MTTFFASHASQCHNRVVAALAIPFDALQKALRLSPGGPAWHRSSKLPTGATALTFDDVLLQPGHSEVMPGQTNIRTRITRDIELNLPIISAAMDTVTESRLAIAMAQAGGIGVIHRNLTPTEQAEEVRQVKKFESGMVVNPVTIGPDATLADAPA